MTSKEDSIILGKIFCDDNNQKRKSWACLGQTCSRLLIVFLSQLLVILLIILGCFRRIHLQKLLTNPLFWWESFALQQDTFPSHQDYDQVNFYKKYILYNIGSSLRDGKVTTYLELAWELEPLQPFKQNSTTFTFSTNSLRHFMMLCKKILKVTSLFNV